MYQILLINFNCKLNCNQALIKAPKHLTAKISTTDYIRTD